MTDSILFSDEAIADDADDRRLALNLAFQSRNEGFSRHRDYDYLIDADRVYRWLRERDTLRRTLTITAGTPAGQGER